MRRRRNLFLIVGILSTSGVGSSQERIVKVTERELRGAASQKIEPEYPAVARQIRLTGDVDLEVSIDNNGSVEKVTVLRGNTLLVGSSMQAIKRWKFAPFRLDGQVAKAIGQIRFTFQM